MTYVEVKVLRWHPDLEHHVCEDARGNTYKICGLHEEFNEKPEEIVGRKFSATIFAYDYLVYGAEEIKPATPTAPERNEAV